VLVVHGGPTTAVIRGRTGESVVLLSGELPEVLTDAAVDDLVDLAVALLTEEEVRLFRRCLDAVRQGETITRRRIEIDGAVLTVYDG
jgi:uridine kinase